MALRWRFHWVVPTVFVLLVATPRLTHAETKASCEDIRRTARFTAHFERVELTKLAQTISDATCRSFIVGENVKGTISLVGPDNEQAPLSADQFYAAFLAALDANGFTVVKQGRFFRIIDKKAARQHPVPVALDGTEYPAPDEVVTRVLKVRNAELEPVRLVLAQLVGPNADLIAAPPDVLIVTDLVSNLVRLEKLLVVLDVPKASELTRFIAVRHADASDVADKVTRVLAPKNAKPGTDVVTVVVDERANRLLVVANPTLLDRAEALVAQLDVDVPGDGRARVYRLKNADAKEVASALEGLTQAAKTAGRGPAPSGSTSGAVTGEVRITTSETQNALVIVASAGDYRTLVDVIEALDVPQRQVFIETVIMEVNVQHDSQFGLSVHGVGGTSDSPFILGSQPSGAPSSLSLASLATSSGLLAGLQGPLLTQVSSALGLSVAQFGIAFQASQTNSDVNVLSTSHILTTDNKEAEISVGQKVPFLSGTNPAQLAALLASGNSTAASTLSAYGGNVQREKVELKLTVKPHIGDGDQLRLEINQQAEEIAGSNTYGPITSTRGQKTSVVARDDETLVLGGIMQDRDIDVVSKVPVLGDIPILGHLFRNTSKKKTKVNLLVFLTPHIIRDPNDVKRVLDRKVNERRKVLEQFYGQSADIDLGIDFARKRGPVAALGHALDEAAKRPENGGEGLPGERLIVPGLAPQSPAP